MTDTVRVRDPDPRWARPDPAVRWGATVLAGCALTFVVTMLLYLLWLEQPGGASVTIAERAVHVQARWAFFSVLWVVEAVVWVLLAIAGFALQQRAPSGPAWLPSRVAWIAVGVGAVIQSLMYPVMLGGYPAAAADAARSPALFASLRDVATIVFYLGNLSLFLGLGGALLGEASPSGAVPRWVAIGGGVACLAVSVLLVGLLAGVGSMMLAAPGALIGYLASIWLGLGIRRRG